MVDKVTPGYRTIEGFYESLDRLAAWTREHHKLQSHLTINKEDYLACQRWPRAASCFEISVTASGVYYRGLFLTYVGGPAPVPPVKQEGWKDGQLDLFQKNDIVT